MTPTRCGNNLQAFGGHRHAVIGRHQRASGGKTTHEGNAPQRAIDRHGHLDCPHRGREAGSSRSVAFPQLGGKKGRRTFNSRFLLRYMSHRNVVCRVR